MGRLIGFSGYATAGKDECCDVLMADFGYQPKLSFSEALWKSLLAINPWVQVTSTQWLRLSNIVEKLGETEAKKFPDVRNYLQKGGTEGGRMIHGERCWVDIVEEKMLREECRLTNRHPAEVRMSGILRKNYCITNVRFGSEEEMVRSWKGEIWRVEREGVGPVNSHSSDNQEIEHDVVIQNNGDLSDLREQVIEAMRTRHGMSPR